MKITQLKNIGVVPPRELNFKDPFTEELTDIFFTVHPLKSKYGKEAEHKMRLRIVELMQDESNIVEVDGKKNLNQDLILEETVAMIANMVSDWKGIEDDKGKAIKFSEDKCIELLKEYQSLADAIYVFSSNMGNFQE